jgi:hypothetical protein
MKELLQQLSEINLDLELFYAIRLSNDIVLQGDMTRETYNKLKSLEYKMSFDFENDWLFAEKDNVKIVLTFKMT